MNVPEQLLYHASHEWVRLEGDTAIVGITDHAQTELTDVVYVELPALGRIVAAGAAAAVVESVKTASDIFSPLAGEVVAVNEELQSNPALINSDPYGDGWIYQLRLSEPAEVAHLLDAAAYAAMLH